MDRGVNVGNEVGPRLIVGRVGRGNEDPRRRAAIHGDEEFRVCREPPIGRQEATAGDVEAVELVVGAPDRSAAGVGGIEVEPDLGIEREVAVVVGEPRDEVVPLQHALLRHVVD